VKLFLDTSVLLAACGSAKGSSRAVFQYAPAQGWELMASPWVIGEVTHGCDFRLTARPRRPITPIADPCIMADWNIIADAADELAIAAEKVRGIARKLADDARRKVSLNTKGGGVLITEAAA
jgi:hypothetical protein